MKKNILIITALLCVVNLTAKIKFGAIPFAYYSAEFKTAFGAYAAADNIWQEGTHIKLGGLTSTNKTHFLFYQMREFRVPFTRRLFFEPNFYFGRYGAIKIYQNPYLPLPYDQLPGHNDSDGDAYFEVSGKDIIIQPNFSWLLPIGDGKNHIKSYTKLKSGRVVESENGGTSYNPFKSGRTKFILNPFYRKQKDIVGNGLELTLLHENFDWDFNPTKGNKSRITWTKDFGTGESKVDWEKIEVEYAEYIRINNSRKYPLVLVLDGWASHCSSWNMKNDEGLYKRPPSFAGTKLGGKKRFRAYYEGRFNDRSAVCYIAEIRQVFKLNPLKDNRFLEKFGLNVKWMQTAYFFELGRVARDWDIEELHRDMKHDFGIGLRINADTFLLRLDYAYGSDGSLVQMFIDQPF
ncbi:MAG: hypothetical protein CSB55_07930 [Candidatus Cloacimonadota bacterium]|nr:MAG: hypothetical protein CSB55_07930 [Candidatus Cloacimonadota bacterium]